jgi:hypothetical protein
MRQYCDFCGRIAAESPVPEHLPCLERAKGGVVYYVHDSYGCDTGCCGHRFYFESGKGETTQLRDFEFTHDKDALDRYAGEYAAMLGISVAWDRCQFNDD